MHANKYAQQLKEDCENIPNVSYAGKWAPREGSKYDKEHKLASKLANLIFSDEGKHSDALKKYRKLIVQLTNEKNVIEPKMAANQWDEVSNCLFSTQNTMKYKKVIEQRELKCIPLQDSRKSFKTLLDLYPIDHIFN